MGVTGSNRRGRTAGGKTARTTATARATTTRTTTTTTPMSSGGGGKMHFTIASDFAEGRVVQKQILDHVEACGFDGDAIFAIKLALEEALINAIKHGNKLDHRKHVKIDAAVTPSKCEISIEDQGPGFDRTCVPDPTAEENLTKCSGRGILLMETYMNEVWYSKNGRRVHMIKHNDRTN
jgi:serine/threonine-protein kinase RsbW